MSIFEKQRWEIWNLTQHPYRHSLAEFSYTNPALPGVTNIESAMNWMLAVLYPNTQPNVATPAALPGAGNTIGDYRVVDDDGDGRSAGYRWEQREGDVSPQWYKVFDVDWSTDAILAAVTDVVDYKYVWQYGKSDLDETGAPIVGLYAGQSIYGGDLAGQNLTLNANSGDGVGADTGFVQFDSAVRPVVNNTYDFGTATERWKDAWFQGTVTIGAASLILSEGSITDTSGAISFGDENLSTTGNMTGAVMTGSSLVADDTTDTVTIVPGTITDTSGAISFGAANLLTTGTLGAGVATFSAAGGGGGSTFVNQLAQTAAFTFFNSGDAVGEKRGQQFTANSTGNISQVEVGMINSGSTSGQIKLSIQADNGSNNPDGVDVNGVSALVDFTSFIGGPTINAYALGGSVPVVSGQKYWIVFDLTITPDNSSNLRYSSGNPIPEFYAFNTGGGWTLNGSNDVTFQVEIVSAAVDTITVDPDNSILTSSTGSLDFVDNDLVTTGTFGAGAITGTQLDIDNLRLDGNSISSTDANGNINVVPDGTGILNIQKTTAMLDAGVTGTLTVTGQINVDNINLNGNVIGVTDVDGSLELQGNGLGFVILGSDTLPSGNGALDLGRSITRWADIYLAGNLSDGSSDIAISTLLSFRSGVWRDLAQTQPAQDGDTLFYDFANGVWLASVPDSEITHNTISGLTDGDAGHTQFAMLEGRSGGQVLNGSTLNNENLTLSATSFNGVSSETVDVETVDSYQQVFDASNDSADGRCGGFIPTTSGSFSTIQMAFQRFGAGSPTTESFDIAIQADDGTDKPDNVDLAKATVLYSSISTSPMPLTTYTLDATVNVTGGQVYWIVIKGNVTGASNIILGVGSDDNSVDPDSYRRGFRNNGGAWTTFDPSASYTYSFSLDVAGAAIPGVGLIQARHDLVPEVDASFSGTWSGTDLGDSTHYWKDVYTKGEFFGFRFENTTSGALPAASAQNIGRTVYATDNEKAYIDTGTAFKVLGISKFVADVAFDGSQLTEDVDVSSDITDARNCVYVLLDNANDFEKLYVTLKATSASNVRIETSIPLPAGSYRLIVIE